MTQVIINPREARRFAKTLIERSQSIQERKRAVSDSFGQLKAVWRDQRYHEFSRLFEDASRILDEFSRSAERCSDYLTKKAGKIEKYLGQSR